MPNLFDPPQIFNLPLTKGRDLFCEFIYEPLVVDVNGDPVLDGQGQPQYAPADYPIGATVELVIDVDPPIVASVGGPPERNVVITGDTAVVLVDHTLVTPELAPKGKFWRLGITYANDVNDVLANGKTIRSDGATTS